MPNRFQNYFYFFLTIVFLAPGIAGLVHSGFPLTDDGNWMIIRFSAFYESLRNGQFPVRFLNRLNHGYGYPVADFLYPLFMYIGVPIHVLGFNFNNTIKIIFGGSLLLSGVFCFLWLTELFNNTAALIGAIAYSFFPYHLWDVYKRGSIGEVLATAIVPFIFWQIEKTRLVPIAFGIALLILSHNSLALLFLPIITSYMLLKKFTFHQLFIVLITSLSLSAFFWIPAVYDKQFTVFDKTSVSDFARYFIVVNDLGLLGIISFVTIALSFIYLIKRKTDAIFFIVITIFPIFLAISVSSFLWKLLPLPQLIQFPFRFLSVVMLGVAFLSSYTIETLTKKWKIIASIVFLLVIYLSAWSFIYPKIFQEYPDSFYATNQATTTVKNEYMPLWVQQVPLSSPNSKVEIVKGKGEIHDFTTNGNRIYFTTTVYKTSKLHINILYFPGWKIYVNNKAYAFSYNNSYGVMEITLDPGNYAVLAKFGETPLRMVADIISLTSVVFLGFLISRSIVKNC